MASVIFQNQKQNASVSEELFSELFTNNPTFNPELPLATAVEDVKFKHHLRNIREAITFQDPSCEFLPPNSAPTIDARILEVLPYSFQRKLCMEDIRKVVASSENLKRGTLNDYLGTPELANEIMNYYGERIAAANNKLFWLGASALAEFSSMSAAFRTSYLGFLPAMIADTQVNRVLLPPLITINNAGLAFSGTLVTITHPTGQNNDVQLGDALTFSNNVGGTVQIRGLSGIVVAKTATTTQVDLGVSTATFSAHTTGGLVRGVNVANVVSVMQSVYRAIPEAVKAKGNFVFCVSGRIADAYAYSQALAGGNGVNSNFFVGKKQMDFLGYPVVRMPNWQENVILAHDPDNLFVGFDARDDENIMDIKYLGETTMDYVYGIRVEMKTGVQYNFPREITILKPADV